MEKNMKKNIYIYVYVTELLCFTAEINIALYMNYTFIKNIDG